MGGLGSSSFPYVWSYIGSLSHQQFLTSFSMQYWGLGWKSSATLDSIWLTYSWRSIPRHRESFRVNPVDSVKVQCTTRKLGVPPRTGLDSSRLHTYLVIHTFWQLRNALEVGHTIVHHLPWWRLRVIVKSKVKHSKYI